MCWGEASEPVIPIPQEFVGCNVKYIRKLTCSNGINIKGILRIQSMTDGDWENILKIFIVRIV